MASSSSSKFERAFASNNENSSDKSISEQKSELEQTAQFRYDTVFEQAVPSEVTKVKQKPEAV
jgi:hypothetical protein